MQAIGVLVRGETAVGKWVPTTGNQFLCVRYGNPRHVVERRRSWGGSHDSTRGRVCIHDGGPFCQQVNCTFALWQCVCVCVQCARVQCARVQCARARVCVCVCVLEGCLTAHCCQSRTLCVCPWTPFSLTHRVAYGTHRGSLLTSSAASLRC